MVRENIPPDAQRPRLTEADILWVQNKRAEEAALVRLGQRFGERAKFWVWVSISIGGIIASFTLFGETIRGWVRHFLELKGGP